jgi:heme A synthase
MSSSQEHTKHSSIRFGLNGFSRYAWAVLAYNVGVVLWGAYVRASGSGAGCGNHWPLCNGQVVPQSPQVATLIEFSHRVSSGLTVLFMVGLAVWAFLAFPKGHRVRLGAGLAMLFTITEALVGAGLVLYQLVASNASLVRALIVAVHLTNTFLLLASLALTALWASGGRPLVLRGQGMATWLLALGLLGVLALGMTGAVTALGDTLFPPSSLAAGLRQDLAPTTLFLIRLRVFHPLIAVSVGLYVILLARYLSSTRHNLETSILATIATTIVIVQLMAGVVNVVLLAPVWMQLLHLLLADLVWITLVLLAATTLVQGALALETAEPQPRASYAETPG